MKINKYKANNINQNVLNTAFEMNNTMQFLYEKGHLYFFNEVSRYQINNEAIISWNNHISGRANCGESFLRLEQYDHILNTGSYHCIISDGSLIRSSFVFEGNELKNHSHLWWPSPYDYGSALDTEFTPHILYEMFIGDKKWNTALRMRSPVRIDFDSSEDREDHPLIHMHTQNHECRMKVSTPICFNKFIKYIFQNFYPEISLDFTKWNFLNYTYSKSTNQNEGISCIIL